MKFALLKNGRMIASFSTNEISIQQVVDLLGMGYAIMDYGHWMASKQGASASSDN